MEGEVAPQIEIETEKSESVYAAGVESQAIPHLSITTQEKDPFDSPQEQSLMVDMLNRPGAFIFINPAHGNEPYRGGVDIALSMNKLLKDKGIPAAKIVVPLLFPGRQEKILKEEFPGFQDEIFVDDTLGKLYQEILFRDGNYPKHLDDLLAKQPRVQEAVRDYLSRTFQSKSLATGIPLDFNGRNLGLDINYGSRVVPSDQSHFVFPVLLSELLEETAKTGLPFDMDKMAVVQRMAQDMEAQYKAQFIPKVNTLSYQNGSAFQGDKIYTPPLKHERTSSEDIPHEAIYVMASGTGSQMNTLLDASKDMGLSIYHSPFIQMETGTAALPDVIHHPNIVAVLSRTGWGTGWICQQAETPFITLPYEAPDDPEMFFNNKTIEDKRLGVVYKGQRDIIRQALETTGDIKRINAEVQKEFGTNDGVDFVAQKIVEGIQQKKGSMKLPRA